MLGRVLMVVAMGLTLAACDVPAAQVSVDESTEAFVKRVIESGNGKAGF